MRHRHPTAPASVLLACIALIATLVVTTTQHTGAVDAEEAPGSASRSGLGPSFALPSWGDSSAWSDASSYETIQIADIDGSGRGELIGRGPSGLETWKFTNYHESSENEHKGYWSPLGVDESFSNDAGWTDEKYYSTIQTADITGDGSAELLSRDHDGLKVSSWDTSSASWQALDTDGDFSNDAGWGDPQFYETIQTLADGEGGRRLIARGAPGIHTFQWDQSSSSWEKLDDDNPAWSDDDGWDEHSSYSTIQGADVTDNGADELIGRSPDGLEVYTWNTSEGKWDHLSTDSGFANPHGWDDERYYSTIQFGNILGDTQEQFLSRDHDGLQVREWTGSAWQLLDTDDSFSDDNGWDLVQYFSTIQLGDVIGDGAANLLARDSHGLNTYSFQTTDTLEGHWESMDRHDPAMSNDNGWAEADRYRTISTGQVTAGGAALVARDTVGLRTWFWNFPGYERADDVDFPSFNAAQQRAYADVNHRLDVSDLRSSYDVTSTGDLTVDLEQLRSMSSPDAKNLTRAEWKALKEQLTDELTWAVHTVTSYTTMREVLDHSTLSDDLSLSTIVSAIDANPSSDHTIDVVVGALASAITDAVIEVAFTAEGGPIGAIAGGLVAAAWSGAVDHLFDSGVSGTVHELESDLASDYESTLSALQGSLTAMTTNYGLLLPVGQHLGGDHITTPQQQTMRNTHIREWTRFAYQTAAHAEHDGHSPTWGVFGCGPTSGTGGVYNNSCQDYAWDPPDERYTLDHEDGVMWIGQFKTIGADNLSDSMYERLYGETSDDCLHDDFTTDCNLEFSKEELMFDWDLHECWSPAMTGCPAL